MKNLLTEKLLICTSMLMAVSTWGAAVGQAAEPNGDSARQLYEVRTYLLGEDGDEHAVDQYLQQALLTALKRQNIGPIGVFSPAANDTNQRPAVIVVIPFESGDAMTSAHSELQRDKRYLADADSYLDAGAKKTPFARITSELLVAMQCMPELKVAADTLQNADRVYELRLYESANERLGSLKVDMFNNGEVPIFLDCGISPVFIGQAIIGPQTPNLTYLTVYPNDEARLKAWDDFRSHPDWQVLKQVAKYKGTVSKIDKHILKAKPFSEM